MTEPDGNATISDDIPIIHVITAELIQTEPLCQYKYEYGEFDPVAFYANLIVLPIICVFGTIAACICVIVFTRKQMRSSLNVYLAGLSFFDLILLLFSLFLYMPLQGCVEMGKTNNVVCRFFWITTPYFLPISNIAQTCSVWACVGVTVDRFLAVSYPLHSKIWCTPKRALSILICITTASIIYRIPSFLELNTDDCGVLKPTDMRNNPLYKKYYIMYGYVLFILLIPWTVMIILNIFVVKAVHRAYKIRQTMQGSKGQEERDKRCTLMALVMITTFLLFNILAAVNNIAESFQVRLPEQFHPLGNLLICFNSASNIVIYALFGARFRHMCVVMLCGRNSRWMNWLKAGGCRMIVSDWDAKDLTTRKTSLDASTALLSARSSCRRPSSSSRYRRTSQLPQFHPSTVEQSGSAITAATDGLLGQRAQQPEQSQYSQQQQLLAPPEQSRESRELATQELAHPEARRNPPLYIDAAESAPLGLQQSTLVI